MKLLVIGGTVFVGWHIVDEALRRGHDVTLVNRGLSDRDAFVNVERIVADRAALTPSNFGGKRWDAVVDVCGYEPSVVEPAAKALAERAETYTFVSSLGVYEDRARAHQDESAALLAEDALPGAGADAHRARAPRVLSHGLGKVLCERVVDRAFPGRALHLRCGLMAGYRDRSDRFTYWPARLEAGGDVLAPGSPDTPVQVMHVRDFARFALDHTERRTSGVFNVAGPETTLGGVLEACRSVAQSDANLCWVSESFLLDSDLQMYVDIPLWVSTKLSGINQFAIDKATSAGLRHRPLVETIVDVLAWHHSRPREHVMQAGLSADRERALLEGWRRASAAETLRAS